MSYSKPAFEVAQVIDQFRHKLVAKGKLPAQQKKVLTNLWQCRTAALGYHKDKCDNPDCSHVRISYNSCRDRHCPKCNGIKREKWVRMREKDLLPVKYFHVVFTLPDTLNGLFLCEPEKLYNLLFASAWQTVKKFGLDHKHLGAQTGMIAILHSWGQNLALHPHIHCLIPAGGITQDQKWRHTRQQGKYLFPVKPLGKVFRGKFTDGLIDLHNKCDIQLDQPFVPGKKYLHPLYKNKWVVYAKLPMHNSLQVVNYIGRYSHRIAISNHRIKAVENDRVKFSWVDYRTSKTGIIDLSGEEFLQRFSLHILPFGFMKIRHYGILSSRNKTAALACARKSLGAEQPKAKPIGNSSAEWLEELFGSMVLTCPVCRKGTMKLVAIVWPRSRGSPLKMYGKGFAGL
jgi:hypothetical protein